jgi:hypothetical protein
MTPKIRAVEARMTRIERELLSTDRQIRSASEREDAGDVSAGIEVLTTLDKQRRLIEQASRLRPLSKAGFASKARVVGRYIDKIGLGRAALRSLVEDLHAAEWSSK